VPRSPPVGALQPHRWEDPHRRVPTSLRRAYAHWRVWFPLHPVADPTGAATVPAGATSSSSSGGSDGRGFGGRPRRQPAQGSLCVCTRARVCARAWECVCAWQRWWRCCMRRRRWVVVAAAVVGSGGGGVGGGGERRWWRRRRPTYRARVAWTMGPLLVFCFVKFSSPRANFTSRRTSTERGIHSSQRRGLRR
jgi:hypothetical protein